MVMVVLQIQQFNGGTLGIFLATALCAKGLRVDVVERNAIKERDQEWNISKKEMKELIEVGVLTEDEIEEVIAAKFNPGGEKSDKMEEDDWNWR